MADYISLPFKADYAKSDRATCRGCKAKIGRDALRIAILLQPTQLAHWYHYNCLWQSTKIAKTTDIFGFDTLRWDDQKKIKDKLEGFASGEISVVAKGTDFAVEYAKSGRATCRKCEEKIDKNSLRISKKDFTSKRARRYGPQDIWYHVDCLMENKSDLGLNEKFDPSRIPGYDEIEAKDKAVFKTKLQKPLQKKRKLDEDSDDNVIKKQKSKETAKEKGLRKQSKILWELRDKLKKEIPLKKTMKELLRHNGVIDIPSGRNNLLDLLCDSMAFGTTLPCPECKGQIVYRITDYKCAGNLTEWTKCMYTTIEPKRKAWTIPEKLNDVELFKEYKYKVEDRIFPEASMNQLSSGVDKLTSTFADKNLPLQGLGFVITVKTITPKEELEKKIKDLGGWVYYRVRKMTAGVISTEDQVQKKTKHIVTAEKLGVHVISEDYLDAVVKGGAALLISTHSIAPWGSDPHDRINADDDDVDNSGPSSSTGATNSAKNTGGKTKMTVKGGAVVDPLSKLEHKAHVYQGKADLFTSVLGVVDIVRESNCYYKLQLLESDTNSNYWLFRTWGQVGKKFGHSKLEDFTTDKKKAVNDFRKLYFKKTGNDWDKRKDFIKYPNKYYEQDIDYSVDDEEIQKLNGTGSKLPTEVQQLIKMIFDVESMKKVMLEFEIDIKKMPLGKLSKKQIEAAYRVLTELNGLIKDGGSTTQFLDASNRFYTLIPQDFGKKKMTILHTEDVIKSKTNMLDNLLEIEVAYSLLKSGGDQTKDPIDVHYEQLKTDIEVMDKKSEEYKRLVQYLTNTHGHSHVSYDLEIQEIFKIERADEAKIFEPFKKMDNHMLLWHGSRITNYAGILSQGLRIAPPEAPMSGYMFGKGIYFADMVSKSANYCRTSKSDPVGLLLLADVALGNMYELTASNPITKLPTGKDSTKGIGMTTPDPIDFHTTNDGVVIPMGKGINAGLRSSLGYNEYIVYDVAQANMKYLLQVKFNHKY